jgi:hypothetical protein
MSMIGKVIKSLDFPHTDTCYMIGVVIEETRTTVKCRTVLQMFRGKEDPITEFNKEFSTNKQGFGMFDAKYQRVTVIG